MGRTLNGAVPHAGAAWREPSAGKVGNPSYRDIARRFQRTIAQTHGLDRAADCTRTSISISRPVGGGALEEGPPDTDADSASAVAGGESLSAEYRRASGITVCLKSTAILRPDTFICHSPPNEEQVRGVFGKSMGSNLEFAGKVVLITGGNSGIGAAAARRVAELRAQVVVTGRRQSKGRLLVSDIKCKSGSAAFIQADLSQPEQVKRIVPFTLKTFGRLDYAFNDAGISGENRPLTDQTEKTFDRVFAVNVKALFLLLKDEVKQTMAQGHGGSIVNTASVGGLLAFPTAGPYWPANTLCSA
jgi:hypothetical protein